MGAAIAVDFTLQFPERVQTLVTLDGGAEGTPLDNTPGEFLDRIIGYYTTSLNQGVRPALEQWIQDPLFAPAIRQPELETALREIVLEGHSSLGSNAMFQWPNPQRFAELSPPAVTQIDRIEAPTLAIVGELDLPDFHGQIDRIDEIVRNSRKLVIPGVGHMSSMEDPSTVNAALIEFFAAHPITDGTVCDFNMNGVCDTVDLDSLLNVGNLNEGIALIVGANDQYDVNGDHVIDTRDLDYWLSKAGEFNGLSGPYPRGDANLDGIVNAADLNTLAINWRSPVAAWSGGDFTADGIVDAQDLNALAVNWRKSISNRNEAPVPEPSARFLAIFALLAWPRYLNAVWSSDQR